MSLRDRVYSILLDGTPQQEEWTALVGKPSSSLVPSTPKRAPPRQPNPYDEYIHMFTEENASRLTTEQVIQKYKGTFT